MIVEHQEEIPGIYLYLVDRRFFISIPRAGIVDVVCPTGAGIIFGGEGNISIMRAKEKTRLSTTKTKNS